MAAAIGGWGGQTGYGELQRVLVMPPVPPAPEADWREFGYLRPMNHSQAVEEHQAFRDLLRGQGIDVVTGEIDDPKLQDGIFVYDPVMVVDAGAIICRPGKELRAGEADLAARTMADLGIPIAGRIAAPGTLEGGDCFWIDERTLAVGEGYRTNAEGIRQLREILTPHGVEIVRVGLPHWNEPAECLHLLSLISPLDRDLAVVHLPLLEVAFVEYLVHKGIELVEIPEHEFVSQGTNVLALGPQKCLLLKENPETGRRLEAAGCEVIFYTGGEISHNRTGGPTCLTRPLLRG